VDTVLIPTFWSYKPRRIFKALARKHHKACLWTQLVFCLALCLAGFIRQLQSDEWIGVYESASIVQAVPTTIAGLVIATASYFPESEIDKFDKRETFVAAFILAIVMGFVAVLDPTWGSRTGTLLAQCALYADAHNEEWRDGAIAPIQNSLVAHIASTVATIVAVLISLTLWSLLRRNDSGPSGVRKKIVVAFLGLTIGYLMYDAGDHFTSLLSMRYQMGLLWERQNGQNTWTIGQIGALFTWAPLLVDMLYSATRGVRGYVQHWRHGPSSDAPVYPLTAVVTGR
jgi:chromate transport protein ChrA